MGAPRPDVRGPRSGARGGSQMNLEGKVAVVTGSGRGIGRAYARALAQAGCAVVINDIDSDVAEQTV
ncbi:MAG TPA: SDR family NAD(P)-dependent oxidoreductase, partial [Candidatus Dormibacteraeota bacterium]|nr:SDR family NAD(P)-dependent oxidoreductase [Candidatus Dormibacteraeota bacterium]